MLGVIIMHKSYFYDLKLEQVSSSIEKKALIPIDKLSERLKDVRAVLGMTQTQLAKRLKVRQSVVSRIEKNLETCSLKTIEKVVRALGCRLMCSIVADVSLKEQIKARAAIVAKNILSRTYSNMAMEKQDPGQKAYDDQLVKIINDLLSKPGSELWEDEE